MDTGLNSSANGEHQPNLPETHPSQPPIENSFDWLTITFLCISVIALFVNLSMVYLIARPANKELRTSYLVLLANLAICDSFNILTNAFSPMAAIINTISLPWLCGFILASRLIVKKATTMGLMLVSLEKFIAIRFPFFYEEKSSVNLAITVSAMAAVASILYGTVPITVMLISRWSSQMGCVTPLLLPLKEMMYLTVVGNYAVEFVVIASVYSYITSVVIRVVSRTPAAVAPSQSIDSRAYLRGALKCILIILVHIVCQWPMCINTVVEYKTGHLTPLPAAISLHKLSELNSWINPLLYVFTSRALRDVILQLMRCDVVPVLPNNNQVGQHVG